MKMERLYRKYFQKSKVFLYPALGITYHYGVSLAPVQTYIGWQGISPKDKKLICLYNKDSPGFGKFEKEKLLGSKEFLEYKETEDLNGCRSGAYIFDLKHDNTLPDDYLPNMRDRAKRAVMWSKLGEQDKRAYSLSYSMSHNWDLFLLGKYSRFSMSLKKKVKEYYKYQQDSYVHIESFLHPNKYYTIYSDLLGVDLKALQDAGELTDRPDLEKETLQLNVKSLKVKI